MKIAFLGQFSRYLRRLSISQKFYLIIGVVLLILIIEIASFWITLDLLSDVRAYVGGESEWSKSQKESLASLLSYSATFKESDYASFMSNLSVPLGDEQARLELEKKNPDLARAEQGFAAGQNDPADIGGMLWLFMHFRWISSFSDAIVIWTNADGRLALQREIGGRMHADITGTAESNRSKYQMISPLIIAATQNDAALSSLENRFSATFGEASRDIGNFLYYTIVILTLIFAMVVFVLANFISRLLEEVDKAKTEFVALTSHQLRSPLSIIGLSIELLKKLNPTRNADDQELIDGIEREVHQMNALVETILDISRIELGKVIIEPEYIDVMAAARAQIEAFAIIARHAGVSIRGVYEPMECKMHMDPTLLQIILQNLISNAIKYTNRGGTVELAVIRESWRLLIRVADTGRGIAEKYHRDIFQKLFRSDNARETGHGGAGLGLYIIKTIVDAAGGDIWFESTEGKGTTFFIAFPHTGMKAVSGNVRL